MKKDKQVYRSLASSNSVFTEHKWGNSSNAGVNYERPYSKTKSSAKKYNEETTLKNA